MLYIRTNFLLAVSALSLVDVTNSLQKFLVDSDILITEEIVRNTTNKLFSTLKLKRDNPRLSQYIIINKHFTSITLQDHDSLNEIAKLSRESTKTNNGSRVFMTAINELLNDDNHNIEENEIKNNGITENQDDYIVDIIESFLKRLREAKDMHDVDSYVKINENVLNLIKGTQVANTTGDNEEDDHMAINNASEEIEFWKPSGRRIYGGERTKIKHFPFMASIQMFNNFQCAGSIIKSDLIITASSCLQLAWNNRFFRENPAFLSVRVGSSFYSGGGEVISILEVYFHPEYDPKTLRNNICVVRLTRKIKFSWRAKRRVRKIDIDRYASKLPFNTPGVTILGWGAKGRSNIIRDPWTNILSFAVLDIYPLRECQDLYSKEYVTYKNFCAGFMSRGGGACNRDIGGPGIDDGILVGVVSFGSPVCGAVDAPTVFTKLGYYADWIESVMEQDVPFGKKKTTPKPERPLIAIKHTPLKSTTFKIPPLPGGKFTPIPINEIENVLRMFDDDLFHEFMRTMFDSKEMAEYQDVFKEVKQDMVNKILKDGEKILEDGKHLAQDEKHLVQDGKHLVQDGKHLVQGEKQLVPGEKHLVQDKKHLVQDEKHLVQDEKHLVQDEKNLVQDGMQLNKEEPRRVTSSYVHFGEETATKLLEFDVESIETATEQYYANKYTVVGSEIGSKRNQVDSKIEELIKNIDLKKIIEEEAVAAEKKEANAATKPNFFDEMESGPEGSKRNESVMTLLYLSKENKVEDTDVEDNTEEINGLSIATDSFQDLTRTKGKSLGDYNGLPEKEFYEILSEVIDDEMRNIETE